MVLDSNKTYAEEKITEVLKASRGNSAQAQKMLIELALQDQELLVALVRPHMKGIVAHAVDRAARGKTAPEAITSPKPAVKRSRKDSIGMDILKTIAGGETAQFGQENYGRPLGKKGASQRHIDAIHQIIKSGESKK